MNFKFVYIFYVFPVDFSIKRAIIRMGLSYINLRKEGEERWNLILIY